MDLNKQDFRPEFRENRTNLGFLLTKPYLFAINKFQVKVKLFLEKEDFIIKTAENDFELEQVLRLRHDVFIKELLNKKKIFGIDIDKYDMMCDHLLVIEKKTGSYVGTYRLNSDLYSDQFYSEKEFFLGSLMDVPGLKLEIGRACIHRDFRKSNMMGLLWEGIYAYMGLMNARYVFGCSSIMTTNPLEIAMVHKYLVDKGHSTDEMGAYPRKKYVVKDFNKYLNMANKMNEEEIHRRAEKLIPKLIKDYFNFGAKIYGEPALDKSFQCIDVLTMLDLSFLNHSYKEERLTAK